MPGRFFLETSVEVIANWLGADWNGEPVLPRRNVAPGQEITVCNSSRQIVPMRWGMIPVGRVNARGRPVLETVINARSETVFAKSAFEGVERVIVPADGWYEWTGDKRRKTAWRVRLKSGEPLAFAGISDRWTAPGGQTVDQVATITCAPNNDVKRIHHRMGVILNREDFATWLGPDREAAAGLMCPLPDGLLSIEEAADVDWSAP